jgi:hypothetical protein
METDESWVFTFSQVNCFSVTDAFYAPPRFPAINPFLFQGAQLSSIASKAERRYSCEQIAKSLPTNRCPVRRRSRVQTCVAADR